MIGRWLLALAALVAAAGLARAADGQVTVAVVRDCPAKGWHRACLPIDFFFRDDGSGRLHGKMSDASDDGSLYPHRMLDYIVVKGSLLENRGRGVYRLKLDYHVSDSEADSPDELGTFAFLGRSAAGWPVVLTDRGPLEIMTPSVVFDIPEEVYLVREKTGRVISRLVGTTGSPFAVTKAGEIGVWDARRSICISAVTNRTRELAIITTACKEAGIPNENADIGGNVEVADDISEADALRMVDLYDAPRVSVYRVPSRGLLLIWVDHQYCC